MTSLSTHVLDTSLGRPAAGVTVRLLRCLPSGAGWFELGEAMTDADGRIREFPLAEQLSGGEHRLVFDTREYFDGRGGGSFFPRVVIDFELRGGEHHHVPLLLSPFGFTTYRGS